MTTHDLDPTHAARQGLTVLQVTPELDAGGVERTTVDIAAAITAAGGTALVASRGGRLEGELAAAGGALLAMPAHAKDLRLITNARRLAGVIKARGVDVVHARSRAPAWSALWAARATDIPFVTTYHGTYRAKGRLKRVYNGVMARGDAVIANSQFIADRIAAEHGAAVADRVVVIPRGVDTQALHPAAVTPERAEAARQAWGLSAGDPPVILLPGRLTAWKGQAVAIEALALLRARGGPAVRLVLLGDDQGRAGYRAALAALAAGRGVEEAVLMPGHWADMPAAYAVADLVLSASTEPEAFGRVAVEAQVMARPVIATDHGGARETVDPAVGGLLVPPGEAAALADAVASLLQASPEARLNQGEAAAARARRLFSVRAMQAATLAVYERLLETRSDA